MTVSCQIFLYTTNSYEELSIDLDDHCEKICNKICRKLCIKPVVQLLFAIRCSETKTFIPGCNPLKLGVKYDFRMRFKMSDLTKLKQLDKTAYEYYFCQVKHDLLFDEILELDYSKHKEKILGLAVADMYLQMVQHNETAEKLGKNYKKFLPKRIIESHPIFARRRIRQSLNKIVKKDHDPYYIMESYLMQINNITPNYLAEQYNGMSAYLKEDNLTRNGTCPVKIQISPYHNEEPALRVFYGYKDMWLKIAIEDMYAIIIENDKVYIERKNERDMYTLTFSSKQKAESFVSGIAGYYRLMIKWTVDLCHKLASPALKQLTDLRCHGPIGYEWACKKLDPQLCGYFLLRQCGKNYETYFIDVKIKNTQIETFEVRNENGKWFLHTNDEVIEHSSILSAAKSIKTDSTNSYRMSPSPYDKPPQLLLCLKREQSIRTTLSDAASMRHLQPRCIDGSKDLRLFKDTQHDCEGGILTQMRVELTVNDKNYIEATLKALKPDKTDKHLASFMHLAHKWSKLNSSDIIKIYGVTLFQPIAIVMESTKYGPLHRFLQKESSINSVCLIDAAHSLAKALDYLQENNIVHCKIRCSTLQVVKYDSDALIVRLADPGLQVSFSENDIPWIPVEYHNNLKGSEFDLKTDIWAYATTLWEIFTRGRCPTQEPYINYFKTSLLLPKPQDCPPDIYKIMLDGWDSDPEKRFLPQAIFIRLHDVKQSLVHYYAQMNNVNLDGSLSIGSKSSFFSDRTEQTYLIANGEHSCSGSTDSSEQGNSSIHGESTTCSTLINGSTGSSFVPLLSPSKENYLNNIPVVMDSEKYRVIIQGKIGQGHYGQVFRGGLDDLGDTVQLKTVAVKIINNIPGELSYKDFKTECQIMKRLNHKNIVKFIDIIRDSNYMAIVMEFIENTSLDRHLHSKSFNPTMPHLLKFAKDIAEGMEFLQKQNIVHRDLAARNVLVDIDETLKISDFGLARFVDFKGYYLCKNMDKALPITWYAPETLEYSIYSVQSDVWSYGVTLFEIFSGGQSPKLLAKREVDGSDILKALSEGVRLKCPSTCPQNIYDRLMSPCWAQEKLKRPTFTVLLKIIDKLIAEYGESV